MLICFAERADTLDCVQPELTEAPVLDIQGGRHPVVEQATATLSFRMMCTWTMRAAC